MCQCGDVSLLEAKFCLQPPADRAPTEEAETDSDGLQRSVGGQSLRHLSSCKPQYLETAEMRSRCAKPYFGSDGTDIGCRRLTMHGSRILYSVPCFIHYDTAPAAELAENPQLSPRMRCLRKLHSNSDARPPSVHSPSYPRFFTSLSTTLRTIVAVSVLGSRWVPSD